MKNERKGLGFPRRAEAAAAGGAGFVILWLVLAGCVNRPAIAVWDDAGLAAEQRLVIEQQQQRLADMGEAIGTICDGLDRAIGQVTASLNGVGDLQSQFREIDAFVRAIIESKRRLEDIQRATGAADAGER
jgi:hypothetical protein